MVKLQDALVAIDTGNIEKGLRLLKELEQKSDDVTKFSVAETYYELGHLENAKKIVDELLKTYPSDGELLTFKAELLIELNNEDEAIAILTEIDEKDAEFLQAQLLLADLYQLQGFDEVAEQKLLKALEKAPDEPIISFGLGDFYLSRGDYQKSIPFLKKAYYAKLDDQLKADLHLKLAEAYSGIGEFEEALSFYEKGLEEKVELHALFNYGYTAFQLERYELAIEQFNKLKQLDPQYTSLYPYLAKAYEALNLLDDSLTTLKEGLKVDEFNESLYVHVAKLCFKMQDPQSGEQFLRKVIELNPTYFDAVSTYAAFLKHEKRYSELLELIETYKQAGEDDPLFVWYEAVAYDNEERYEEAKKCYEEALTHFADDADFLEDYSLFLLESGYMDRAIDWMKKVIKLDATKQHIQELLLELEQQFY